ncbi:hypothetical protein PMAC_002308 [Pneumocystis sp. 'macacae']|nr:hypothetical protein PMAC_002308 [Pneumocystis sp. 'macacae']
MGQSGLSYSVSLGRGLRDGRSLKATVVGMVSGHKQGTAQGTVPERNSRQSVRETAAAAESETRHTETYPGVCRGQSSCSRRHRQAGPGARDTR